MNVGELGHLVLDCFPLKVALTPLNFLEEPVEAIPLIRQASLHPGIVEDLHYGFSFHFFQPFFCFQCHQFTSFTNVSGKNLGFAAGIDVGSRNAACEFITFQAFLGETRLRCQNAVSRTIFAI